MDKRGKKFRTANLIVRLEIYSWCKNVQNNILCRGNFFKLYTKFLNEYSSKLLEKIHCLLYFVLMAKNFVSGEW